jgi:hypothetical protein
MIASLKIQIGRTSYDDPDTGTHAEEIKIESTTDEQEDETD